MLLKTLFLCYLIQLSTSDPHHGHHSPSSSSEDSSEETCGHTHGHQHHGSNTHEHFLGIGDSLGSKGQATDHGSKPPGQASPVLTPGSNAQVSDKDHGSNTPEQASPGVTTGSNNVQVPRVYSPSGVFKGSVMETRKGRRFHAYRGIRYAEPPTGERRFQPPQPIHKYLEEVDASEEGPACPTRAPEDYYKNFSEDCLRLNVYTPVTSASSNASLPVIIFIHAGGFYSMSGRSDLAGPHYLLDRDLVLVTINYRLGSLGFLSTGDSLAPGNNGLKDQVAALRWTRDNIRAFGGDPASVTLTGCSAGSISVVLHMISPMSQGLFHRGIALSGSPIGKVPSLHHERHLAVRQAALLGCPTSSSAEIIDCLRTKSWREIGDSLWDFFEYNFDPVGLWLPVVESYGPVGDRFLSVEPAAALRSGQFRAVPLIVSQTEDEFYWKTFGVLKNSTLLKMFKSQWTQVAPVSLMLPRDRDSTRASERLREAYLHGRPLRDDAPSADGLGKLYGDAVIGFPVHRLASLLSRYSPQKTYYAQFSYVGQHSHHEDPVTKKPIGAMHHDELIYLFNLSYLFPLIAPGAPDSAFVDTLTALWYNFARYGDPNPRGDLPELSSLSWPAMTPSDRKYLRIDKQFSVHSNLFEERFKVWEELYPEF